MNGMFLIMIEIRTIEGDIRDDEVLKRVFKQSPDIVFHLAAHFANQNSVDMPETDLMVNGLGMLKVLQYSQLTNVDRFIFSSSGCRVYGLDSKCHLKKMTFQSPYTPHTK